MAEIVQFTPRASLEARDNLAAFIRQCRDELTVFGADLPWDEDHWSSAGVLFGNLDQTTRKLQPGNALQSPFREFAKAYFRYQQGHRPTQSKQEMRALKCIERALTESHQAADISDVNGAVLDRAAQLARKHFSEGQAYHAGREIERLAKFVCDKRLAPSRLDWRNPNPRARDKNRTGEKAKQERKKRLPNEEALHALADIFAEHPTQPRDIFTTSVVAILMSVPARVSEVLSLPVDCEVYETKRDGGHAYGVRFQPGKGAAPQVKWVPDSMVTIAQEAIARIRSMTEEPRRLARWLEEHPDHFYRHADCPDVFEDQPLSVTEAGLAIGLSENAHQRVNAELRRMGLPSKNGLNKLTSLNSWVHDKLPSDFPWFDVGRAVRYSEALFCLHRHQLHIDWPARPVQLTKPNANWVNDDLATKQHVPGVVRGSIFGRHGYNAGRTEPLKLTSHQFRHLLNTIAQRGGLSQVEIARWSGRADTKQNRAYDHMSEYEIVDRLRAHDESLELDAPLKELEEQIASKIPMTRQEFNALSMPTAHLTELGYCTHDFTMSPCQRHMDCVNCSEQVLVKGDHRLEALHELYQKNKDLRQQADQEIADGTAGADRWYEHLCRTEQRLLELIQVVENPAIENGAVMKLRNPNEFSPVRRAVESKASNSEGEQSVMVEDLRNLLGGADSG